MIRKLSSAVTAAALLFAALGTSGLSHAQALGNEYIDNSALMPAYVSDDKVLLDKNGTPEWVSSLIMAEIRISTATAEGTIQAAVKVLDHYQEMGVNGLWVTPVYDPGETGNGYGNLGPHTIDPAITGTKNYEEGWKILKNFVEEAHKRNIRIFLDVISWGTTKGAPLYDEHPDWYSGEDWGGDAFLWSNSDLREWFISRVVEIGMKTGCDGFRYDVEPLEAGYAVDKEIRDRLYAQGRKMVMFSEHSNERNNTYDFEQTGVEETLNRSQGHGHYTFLELYDLVDSIKQGKNIGSQYSQDIGEGGWYKYYTYTFSTHDFKDYVLQGNEVAMGYEALFAPFIPMWYIGEEWMNSYSPVEKNGGVLYFNAIDWSLLDQPENRAFYERVKAMIRIRRQYPEIFNYFTEHLQDVNICKVNVAGAEEVQPYARFFGDTAVLVIPNYNLHDKSGKMTVYLPFEEMGLDHYRSYTVSDAFTGKTIVQGPASKVAQFALNVPLNKLGVFVVKASGKMERPTTSETDDSSLTSPTSWTDGTNEETSQTETTVPTETEETTAPSVSGEATADKTAATTNSTEPSSKDAYMPKQRGWVLPVVIAAGVVLLVGGGAAALLILKKKKNRTP